MRLMKKTSEKMSKYLDFGYFRNREVDAVAEGLPA